MAFLDYVIWVSIPIIVGGSIGMVIAKLVSSYQKSQDVKKVFKIIEGKTLNNLKLDGKTINVDKFTYKENDGHNEINVTLADILDDIVKKTQPQGLKEEKKGFFRGFWAKKEKKVGEK